MLLKKWTSLRKFSLPSEYGKNKCFPSKLYLQNLTTITFTHIETNTHHFSSIVINLVFIIVFSLNHFILHDQHLLHKNFTNLNTRFSNFSTYTTRKLLFSVGQESTLTRLKPTLKQIQRRGRGHSKKSESTRQRRISTHRG